MPNADNKEAWLEFHRLFGEAEKHLKLAELLSAELAIPSVNELRYAGYHASRARMCELNELHDNGTDTSDELDKAKRHCTRAIYDANEVQLIYYLETLGEFYQSHSKRHTADLVANIIPSFVEDCKTIQKVVKFIKTVQLENDKRDDYYKTCQPHTERVSDIYYKWLAASPAIDSAIRRESNKRLYVKIGIVITGLGLIAAIIRMILQLCGL